MHSHSFERFEEENEGAYLLRVNVCTDRHSAEDGYIRRSRESSRDCAQLLKRPHRT